MITCPRSLTPRKQITCTLQNDSPSTFYEPGQICSSSKMKTAANMHLRDLCRAVCSPWMIRFVQVYCVPPASMHDGVPSWPLLNEVGTSHQPHFLRQREPQEETISLLLDCLRCDHGCAALHSPDSFPVEPLGNPCRASRSSSRQYVFGCFQDLLVDRRQRALLSVCRFAEVLHLPCVGL